MTSEEQAPDAGGELPAELCQAIGLNQNYQSRLGTPYHIQIEDRGPVVDSLLDVRVRRVNVIVYANYGEPNARIVHGRDHDFPDVRTREHNELMSRRIQELASEARRVIEEKEQKHVRRIKGLIAEYARTKKEDLKAEFEEAKAMFPFVFSRAWAELREERGRPGPGLSVEPALIAAEELPPHVAEAERVAPVEATEVEVVYPLDPQLRERVIEIERMLEELDRDLEALRVSGRADAILVQTCRKLADRARDALIKGEDSEFRLRRLEMTSNSLATAWRQVRSRLAEYPRGMP